MGKRRALTGVLVFRMLGTGLCALPFPYFFWGPGPGEAVLDSLFALHD